MAFRVGQKVVCLDAKDVPLLKHGGIYTITKVYVAYDIACVDVAETPPGWFSWRFRPLVEPKVELPACITALLDPANHELVKEPFHVTTP